MIFDNKLLNKLLNKKVLVIPRTCPTVLPVLTYMSLYNPERPKMHLRRTICGECLVFDTRLL